MARQPRHRKESPSKAQISRFINFYTTASAFEDLERAAELARIPEALARKIYKTDEIRNQIDRKLDRLADEQAKLEAKSGLLSVRALDSALVEAINDKEGSTPRVRAIELGYRRTGMIRDGEFYVAPNPNANKNAPSIYRAQQTTLRHTVTEITHTDATAAPVQHHDPIFATKEY